MNTVRSLGMIGVCLALTFIAYLAMQMSGNATAMFAFFLGSLAVAELDAIRASLMRLEERKP